MEALLHRRLAKHLRQLRGDETLARFAKKLGISESSLHRIEMEEQSVSLSILETLCNRLKCDVGALFPEIKTPESRKKS